MKWTSLFIYFFAALLGGFSAWCFEEGMSIGGAVMAVFAFHHALVGAMLTVKELDEYE